MGNLKIPLMDRYIFKEVMRPYFIGVLIITIVMLSNFLYQVADMIIMQDVPVDTVLELLLYQMPEIIVETFPVAVLFAIMSGIGRLNREREITALRMGGFSIYRLVIPLIIFGILISGMTYFLNENVVPWTNHRARNIIREAALQDVMPEVREEVFFEGPDDKMFYVDSYDDENRRLENVIIYDRQAGGDFPEMITATTGEISGQDWILRRGYVHRYDDGGRLEIAAEFEEMEFTVEEDMDQFLARQRTPDEMSREELREEIELFRRSGIDVTSLLVDYHMKIALPFTSLVFVLIGTPLSLGNKDSRALNLGLTVVIIFSYYVIVSFARSFGRNQMIHPITAAWLPHIIFTLLGVLLIIFREKWTLFLNRLMSKIMVFIPIIFLSTTLLFSISVQADDFTVHGDDFFYDPVTGEARLTGDVHGEFMVFNFIADEITVKGEEGQEEIFSEGSDIEMWESQLTGCDFDRPHYYFSSPHLTIYPGDRIIGRHVVFWELDGRLPLFYWPYLVIYLDEREQRLLPDVGFHTDRGFFIRSRYHYLLAGAYPGVLLLDYYAESGPGLGFEQDIPLPGAEQNPRVSFYYQEDHEDLGLYDYKAELEHVEDGEVWESDTWLEYFSYPEYSLLEGEIDIRGGPENHYLRAVGDVFRENYFDENNAEEDEIRLSTDVVYTTNLRDEVDLTLEYDQDIEPREEEVLQRWSSKFELDRSGELYDTTFILERDEPDLPDPEDEDDEDNDVDETVSFMRLPELNVDFHIPGELDGETSLGRYYEDDSDIWALRWGNEMDYGYSRSLPGPFSLSVDQMFTADTYHILEEENSENFWDNARLGHLSSVTLLSSPWRGADAEIEHRYQGIDGESPFEFDQLERENLLEGEFIQEIGPLESGVFGGYDLRREEYLDLEFENTLIPLAGLTLTANTYYELNEEFWGDLDLSSELDRDPYYFLAEADYDLDAASWGFLDLKGALTPGNWYMGAETTYDITEAIWGDLDLEMEYEKEPMSVSAETSYDLDEGIWNTLEMVGRYEDDIWRVQNDLEFDLEEFEFDYINGEIEYHLEDHLSFGLEGTYDFREEELERAAAEIRRHFHCRSLAFSYDHVEGEFLFEYSLDIFPEQPVSIGRDDDQPFLFDVGNGIEIEED